MPFLKEANKDFCLDNNQLKLSEEYKKEYLKHPRKITGSKVFSLMNKDPWKTPFMTWCEMTGIYKEISDDFVVNAGIIIEDKVFNYCKDYLGVDWLSFDAKERGFDEFSGEIEGFEKNEYFGGLLDGVPQNDKDPILEIKTCAKDKWSWKKDKKRGDGLFVVKDKKGYPVVKQESGGYTKWYPSGPLSPLTIPEAYRYQLGLYCYLKKQPKGVFAVTFLNNEDYVNPEKYKPTKDNIKFKAFNQDLKAYEKEVIIPLTDWYKKYILTGVSPKMTEKDKKWLIDKIGYYEFNKLKFGDSNIQK